MGIELRNVLKGVCLNSVWKYAVFWKLKHRTRMVLTWEDAFYDNYYRHDASMNECIGESLNYVLGGHYSHDPLGLALAKMSYHVYSLGEGIIGQVAVTGKHKWVLANKLAMNSFLSVEFSDGWQSQFSAGIRTIVVVDVVPHGVVQLGSLDEVAENMKLVNQIKNVFLSLQDASFGHVMSSLPESVKSSSCVKTAVEMINKQEGLDVFATIRGGSESHQPKSKYSCLSYQNQVKVNLVNNNMHVGETSFCKDLGNGSEHTATPHSSSSMDNFEIGGLVLPSSNFEVDLPKFSAYAIDSSATSNGIKPDNMDVESDEVSDAHQYPDMNKGLDNKLDHRTEYSSYSSSSNAYLKLSAGWELHEALGPAFLKKYLEFGQEPDKIEAGNTMQVPEVMNSSQLTFDTGSENLLEAVVGNVCSSGSDLKSEKSVCKSVHSLLTSVEMTEPSVQINDASNSARYPINQQPVVKEQSQSCSTSTVLCDAMSSKGVLSICPSVSSEWLDKRPEPAKNSKRRAKPGESGRPRPRDRQLIQDRIKELRELVPSGLKCSIDSLLERTVKHMLFLENVIKHADKLNKCAESKMHKRGIDPCNFEQGSSWAVEVGGHLKVSSIIVENLNKNGLMLVEMLSEECSHFLEIAEAIRSLGLTILKGITEEHEDKTWICFVVEGQNNRILHRMDILWSLVQILQPTTTS